MKSLGQVGYEAMLEIERLRDRRQLVIDMHNEAVWKLAGMMQREER